jgi:hypothetical protein
LVAPLFQILHGGVATAWVGWEQVVFVLTRCWAKIT